MPKPRKNCLRKERNHNAIVVDAYGPAEQPLGWYYYLENTIKFPFSARCIAAKVVSPLRKGETVEVRGLAPEDSCAHDLLVLIRWHGRNVAVPLSQLVAVEGDESTVEAIGAGHYWEKQGNCFSPTQACRKLTLIPRCLEEVSRPHSFRCGDDKAYSSSRMPLVKLRCYLHPKGEPCKGTTRTASDLSVLGNRFDCRAASSMSCFRTSRRAIST